MYRATRAFMRKEGWSNVAVTTFSLSHTHTQTHTLSLSHTLSFAHTLSLTHTLSHSGSPVAIEALTDADGVVKKMD